MFEKRKLKKEIRRCVEQISYLEQKRARSQSALVTAILKSEEPNDEDTEYFNIYTDKINDVRNKMHEYSDKLKELQNKK